MAYKVRFFLFLVSFLFSAQTNTRAAALCGFFFLPDDSRARQSTRVPDLDVDSVVDALCNPARPRLPMNVPLGEMVFVPFFAFFVCFLFFLVRFTHSCVSFALQISILNEMWESEGLLE